MKVLQLVVALVLGVALMEVARADDGMDIVTMKRPFCNAFTGCGRKRDPALAVYPQQQQLPLLYRAFRLYPGLRNAIAEARIMRQQQRPMLDDDAALAFNVDNLDAAPFALPPPRGVAPVY